MDSNWSEMTPELSKITRRNQKIFTLEKLKSQNSEKNDESMIKILLTADF